jgi:hypothetical protein
VEDSAVISNFVANGNGNGNGSHDKEELAATEPVAESADQDAELDDVIIKTKTYR